MFTLCLVPLDGGVLAWVTVLTAGLFGCVGLFVVGYGLELWSCWLVCLFVGFDALWVVKAGCWCVVWFN